MQWRKFKLDGSYAIGELFIVVAGVLIALAIGQWNDRRLEQQEVDEILQHLLIDLQNDLANIGQMTTMVNNKEQSLLQLQSVFDSGESPLDMPAFLQDIIVGANFGWNQARPNDTTYQEALSSGKFGLIRDSSLRSEISRYYYDFSMLFVRADERETSFPHLSYQLVPRYRESGDREVLLQVDPSLTADDRDRLVDDALHSPIRNYVVAEINLAKFILHLSGDIGQRCESLMARIETYRASR